MLWSVINQIEGLIRTHTSTKAKQEETKVVLQNVKLKPTKPLQGLKKNKIRK